MFYDSFDLNQTGNQGLWKLHNLELAKNNWSIENAFFYQETFWNWKWGIDMGDDVTDQSATYILLYLDLCAMHSWRFSLEDWVSVLRPVNTWLVLLTSVEHLGIVQEWILDF